ncbi:MAG: hypothetical protein KH420_10205 [Clostridiales bacterium]|nr:hypothetical protein [Clostridiales bacterium]
MTPEVFSEAMNHLSDRYLLEALELQAPRRLRPRRRAAACLCAACLAAALLLGTALAVSTSFRQAVFTFLFPRYDQHQLHEIEAGHQTGSFDLQDTLFSFLQTLNDEDLLNGVRAAKEHGFEYTLLPQGEDLVHAIVVLSTPDDRLMVTLQRKPYGATSGLWQVNSYQLIETAAAQRLIESQPAG